MENSSAASFVCTNCTPEVLSVHFFHTFLFFHLSCLEGRLITDFILPLLLRLGWMPIHRAFSGPLASWRAIVIFKKKSKITVCSRNSIWVEMFLDLGPVAALGYSGSTSSKNHFRPVLDQVYSTKHCFDSAQQLGGELQSFRIKRASWLRYFCCLTRRLLAAMPTSLHVSLLVPASLHQLQGEPQPEVLPLLMVLHIFFHPINYFNH